MDVSTLLTVAQTILQLLDSSALKGVEDTWNFRSQLKKLKGTMSTIKAVLLDAEEQEKHQIQCSQADKDWLEKLRDVVYEAEDLFDKVATLSQREKLANSVGRKVWFLLSHPTFLFSASREIKMIRQKLEAIAKDRRDFGQYASTQHRPMDVGDGSIAKKAREGSHSYVCDDDVVGRDDDKRALIDMLLDSNVEKDISCITVVGIGGLGKTTLAQLAYNDERIQGKFALRLWVSVSQNFSVSGILRKILELLTDKRYDRFGIELLRSKVQQELKGKRYLLVLDDLWNENREEWLKLRDLLMVGQKGSRILVTTRSHLVARVIDNGPTYELEGLSLKDSWHLFERLAFGGKGHADAELVEIGKMLVRRCANIPLVIRIISSLLYGQDISKWRSFRDADLIHLKQDDILPVLKLSYYHLESPLKSCFNYCALFPTDHIIEKKTLIRLWIAQGFIVPPYGQSAEETGELYFRTLLHRGFFQDVYKDDDGEIITCRIPTVMHNLAQEATKSEISVATQNTSQVNGKLRHLSVDHQLPDYNEIPWIASCPVKRLRSFFFLQQGNELKSSVLERFIWKFRRLRVMDLHSTSIRRTPTLDKLLHLRYLDLSDNQRIKALPNSLCKLYNLQTLKVNNCFQLKTLPSSLRRLINLKNLEINGCSKLTHMPPGISSLTCLESLSTFVVGKSSLIKEVKASDLNDLKSLLNIKGSLAIIFKKVPLGTEKVGGSNYLMNMKHLTHICLIWGRECDKDNNDDHEVLLGRLEPHRNLRNLSLYDYPGARFPHWGLWENSKVSSSNLVEIDICNCTQLHHLPSMCQLPSLKKLILTRLNKLEYIENNETCSDLTSDASSLFPSLEVLILGSLPALKGWWRTAPAQQLLRSGSFAFPRLNVLEISCCPILKFVPPCQNVEDLNLIEFNEALSPFNISGNNLKLKRLIIDNLRCVNDWPAESLEELFYLEIHDGNIESLATVEKLFQCKLASLVSLNIICCTQLKSFSGGGFEHLTALETLRLFSLPSLSLKKEDILPWKSLHHNLLSLELWDLPKLENLPKGMQYLTNLRSLSIEQCPKLEALPEWISCLSSLKSLSITGGSRLKLLPKAMQDLTSLKSLVLQSYFACLKERCQETIGEDWHKIQHIPSIRILFLG